ncbi:MAG: hypothetical protein GY852_07130 [bacterium]|nr:hypothetical protein [bacterium]
MYGQHTNSTEQRRFLRFSRFSVNEGKKQRRRVSGSWHLLSFLGTREIPEALLVKRDNNSRKQGGEFFAGQKRKGDGPSSHPDIQTLHAFAFGWLDDAERETLRFHVMRCHHCSKEVALIQQLDRELMEELLNPR